MFAKAAMRASRCGKSSFIMRACSMYKNVETLVKSKIKRLKNKRYFDLIISLNPMNGFFAFIGDSKAILSMLDSVFTIFIMYILNKNANAKNIMQSKKKEASEK